MHVLFYNDNEIAFRRVYAYFQYEGQNYASKR